MSLIVRYGVPATGQAKKGYGLHAFIANVFFENATTGETAHDASLILCRSAFSIGKGYIAVRRAQAFQLVEKDANFLADTAEECAMFLWNGQATAREKHVVMDCLLDNIDQLVMHPPEVEDLNRKALDAYFDGEETFTHGLMDIVNS